MLKKVLGNGVWLFLVDDVSPADLGMLMALYARSPASVEEHLNRVYAVRREALAEALMPFAGFAARHEDVAPVVDAVMKVWSGNHPTARARRLQEDYYVGYGHKSIADCGSTALFVEGCSMLCAKAIQDTPLYNGQEMSSRAVDCAAQPYIDPVGTEASRAVLEGWRALYAELLPRVVEHVRAQYPIREGEDSKQYDRAVRARAFDVCRGFLPFGCATQVAWHSTLRHAADRLGVLRHHPSPEVREVAWGLLDLCRERYPESGFGELAASGVGTRGDREEARTAREEWTRRAAETYSYVPEDPAEDGLAYNAVLDPARAWSDEALDLLATRPRGALLPWSMTALGQDYIDAEMDMGCWRDLQRHRPLVVEPALLTPNLGFESWYVSQLPLDAYAGTLRRIGALTQATADFDPVVRQYYLPLGYRVRTRISGGIPALVYLMELRSTRAVHPILRRATQKWAARFQQEHPQVALHVDRDPDDWDLRRGAQTIELRGAR